MNIEITPKKSDGVERLLQISVPVETVRDAEDKAARRYATSVRLPGFRPGKAPPAMVKKKFADAIRQETLESLVQEAYKEVLEREQLKLASQPHVHDVKFGDNEPLTFELHLEVRPDIPLARVQGFRVQRTERTVTDEQVREQIEQLRDQRATWAPVEERAAPGDMVNVMLATADETGAMPEGKGYPLVLGAGQAIAGIEELIMEARPGETVERPVRWPEDFPDEAQRSKTKTVRVTVQDVKRKTVPDLDEWPLARVAAVSRPRSQSVVVTPPESVPQPLDPGRIDRLQLTAWALLRQQSAGVAGSRSLASQGSLGASQAGARLAYNFTRQIAAAFRMTNDVGRRGGEVAAGLRVQPLAGIPLWIDAERRQRVGRYGGGRSAFALFFEGGVWDRPVPLHLLLNTYLQGGVVGARSRERFIDGELTLTRPVYKRFSAGVGVWGGAQRGVYRVDAGPRVTMRVRKNLRVHFDWRQRLAGNARPGSGPAVTLAGDF